MAHENIKCAYERRAAGVSGSNPISQLAAAQRTLQLQASRAAHGESVADATRRIRMDYSRAADGIHQSESVGRGSAVHYESLEAGRTTATIGDEIARGIESFKRKYGESRNLSLRRKIETFARANGYKGSIVIISGTGPKTTAAAAITRNDIIVFEHFYSNGFEQSDGRYLIGNAILAHELGHAFVPESNLAPELALDPDHVDFCLREKRASEIGLGLIGLTDFERSLLQRDIDICQKKYEKALYNASQKPND